MYIPYFYHLSTAGGLVRYYNVHSVLKLVLHKFNNTPQISFIHPPPLVSFGASVYVTDKDENVT